MGPDGILSYYTAFKFIVNPLPLLHEGYVKNYSRAFRIPTFDRWVVYITSPDMLQDMKAAPEDVLSFDEASAEVSAAILF